MNVQDKINMLISNNKFNYAGSSNISTKTKASAIAYEAIINSKVLPNDDIRNVEKQENTQGINVDQKTFMDQARMNSLAQYNNFNSARFEDNYAEKQKVKIKIN